MNALRLVFGWLFLAGLTAGGTFYALDELDQRGALASLNLHGKFGIVRYPQAKPNPNPGSIPISSPNPINNNPNPGGNNPNPINSNPITSNPQPPTNNPAIPCAGCVTPQPPINNPVTNNPPPANNPVYQPPYQPPYRPPYQQPPNNQRPIYQQPQPPADLNATQIRYGQVRGRSDGVNREWNTTRQNLQRNGQSLRPEIEIALSTMNQYTRGALQALRSMDTGSANRLMDEAEKQMALLRTFRSQ